MRHKGFTLIEQLVVIEIIALLLSAILQSSKKIKDIAASRSLAAYPANQNKDFYNITQLLDNFGYTSRTLKWAWVIK